MSDYEKQKKVDYLSWEWLPRALGFWAWYISTIYMWKNQRIELDVAATIGLGIGIFTWIVAKITLLKIGSGIIFTYLWEMGCGCLARTIVVELFQYLAIASICIMAFNAGEMTMLTAILFFVIGFLNWFLIVFKNI